MTDFNEVWKELAVKDRGIRLEFSLNGETFRISKAEGLMRRLVASERVLKASITDPNGIAEGRYDAMIDGFMTLVSWQKDKELIQFDDDWRDKVIPNFHESLHIDYMLNLPYSVAAVILGESRAAQLMGLGGGSTSQNSEERSDNQ